MANTSLAPRLQNAGGLDSRPPSFSSPLRSQHTSRARGGWTPEGGTKHAHQMFWPLVYLDYSWLEFKLLVENCTW